MKATVNRVEFDKALGIVSRAVSSKSLGSYQQFVKVGVTAEGALSLEATDDELYAKVTISATTDEASEFLVSPLVCDLISRMVGDEVTIDFEPGKVTVKSGRSRYSLVCAHPEVFPIVADYTSSPLTKIPASALHDGLGKTTFCAFKGSGERSSYYTGGVLMRFTPEYLDLVATDGHRLGVKKHRGKFTDDSVDVIIPASNADEIMKLLPDSDDVEVRTYLFSNQLFIEFDSLLLASSLLDVKFPDYTKVIPMDRATSVTVDRKEMHDALRRAVIVSRAKQHNPVVRLKSKGDSLSILTEATDVGSGEEEIECEIAGDDMDIALNPGYLVDVLSQLDTGKVVFHWNSKVTPLVLSSPEDVDFTYVVMPIRIE